MVLDQSVQLEKTAATITEKENAFYLNLNVLKSKEGQLKASEFNIISDENTTWQYIYKRTNSNSECRKCAGTI